MRKKYVIPKAEYEEKRPDVPDVQTAGENEAAKALEILFEGAGTPYGGSGRKSLQEQARAYRKHMQEMEAGYERFTFNASNREGKK
uniref:hypothetical protein n=1 Tax=Enterocloster clostridioformis TaxID=1531 RepID=UPI0025A617D5|nr:hypothetical protein [Enterocloster clostridioformis]